MRLKVWILIKQQHITIFLQRYYDQLLKSLQALCSYFVVINAISNNEFPENLKLADVIPLSKKKDHSWYRIWWSSFDRFIESVWITLNYFELLIAKLYVYDFNDKYLKFIQYYLTDRWQRTKINNIFSGWT